MDEVQLNTLYVVTEGAYLHCDGQTISVEIKDRPTTRVPLHMVQSIACFGRVMASPQLMQVCAQAGIAVNFLSDSGRLMARVDAPGSGNVVLRRQQFRLADDAGFRLNMARVIVAGKVRNSRDNLLRSARDLPDGPGASALRETADALSYNLEAVAQADTADRLLGLEGDAARLYFKVFSAMTPDAPPELRFESRSRRPPLDPVNSLLSLCYSILTHDCTAALVTAGLDPSVGFFHDERPGRPSLALDLVEEFRAPLADRFVVTCVNRKQVAPHDFVTRPGGAVELTDAARKRIIGAFQERKQELREHPFLHQESPVGRFASLQAKILARHIRGDLKHYVPVTFK